MLEMLATDYVRTSRAFGFSGRQIFFGDALRNALIPLLTLVGIVLGYLVAGNVIVETAVLVARHRALRLRRGDVERLQRDPGLHPARGRRSTSLLNLAIDLLYAVIDPRIRLG